MNLIREVILSGNAYQRGVQHGKALGGQIRNFLNDHEARINIIREHPLEKACIQKLVWQHASVIEKQLPEIAEELKGLAAGAEISYEDAVLLQIRIELIGYKNQNDLEGECTTVALRKSPVSVITGQTIDLPGDLTELGCIFRIIPEESHEPEILMYGFAGLLGYLGLNSFGLSININMVLSDDWQPGVPPYLLVRHLLTMKSVTACETALRKIQRSSSRSFLITDAERIVNIECTTNEFILVAGDCLLHTNHYLTDLKQQENINFLFKNSSVKRLNLLAKFLPDDVSGITPEELFNIFSDHSLYPVGICAHSENNIRRSETVGAVVMCPSAFSLYARKGNTCKTVTSTFSISRTPASSKLDTVS